MHKDDGTPLRDLRVIIDRPGEYAMRDGGRAVVREIHPAPGGSATAFTAKGSIWTMRNRVYRPRGHEIWHVSGRYKALGLSARDIVGPYVREEAGAKEVASDS